MPKRSLDVSPDTMSAERVLKKTERSHEENQERAYIAASRRTDRSIEARVQSARMASDIHKKRTGKGFKISEEIVIKEEMYEEEDDDLPRQYRALAAHLRTSSADMNSRLSAYLTNQVAIASIARQQEVNRLFAEQFPNASQVSQQLAQSMYYQPLQAGNTPTSPTATTFHFQAPSPSAPRDRSQSFSHLPAMSPQQATASIHMPSPATRPLSVDHEKVTPPALTPGSMASETTESLSTPDFPNIRAFSALPVRTNAAAATNHTEAGVPPASSTFTAPLPRESSFTAELPPETKLMANIDANDPLASVFLGDAMAGESINLLADPSVSDMSQPTIAVKDADFSAPDSYFGTGFGIPSRLLDIPGQRSTIGTPGGSTGDSWESWVNTDQWAQVDDDTT